MTKLFLLPTSLLLLLQTATTAFQLQTSLQKKSFVSNLSVGGFEYDEELDNESQSVVNPFKNLKEGDELKIDPARLLGPRLRGSNLYLIGMMGCGKSAVGNSLARRMGTYNFLDTDEILENATKRKIADIFEQEGEETFREVEAQVLDGVHAYVRCVVSTGGGIVCQPRNWAKLQTGIVVWLNVTPEDIVERLSKDEETEKRPLLKSEDDLLGKLTTLLDERLSKYKQADVTVDIKATENVEDVTNKLVKLLHTFIDENPPAWLKAKEKAQNEGLDWVK